MSSVKWITHSLSVATLTPINHSSEDNAKLAGQPKGDIFSHIFIFHIFSPQKQKKEREIKYNIKRVLPTG